MELNSPSLPLPPPPPPLKIKRMKQINNYTGLKYLGFWELKSGIPKLKFVAISASVHIHNAQIKGTQYK